MSDSTTDFHELSPSCPSTPEREVSDSIPDNESVKPEENDSKTLEEALKKYEIKLPPKKVEQLKEYCELLWTWNERLNLTRHTTFDKFVSRDLVDSLRLADLLQKGERVLDVGSGGGVPGLVVAILRPDVEIELCDATGKKANALGEMVDALGLDVNVWQAKAEDLLTRRRFHTLTVRAVGKLRALLLMVAPVWNSFDRLLMIKGPNWIAERGEARHYNMFNTLALRKVDEYENPGAEHGSVILQVCRKNRVEEMRRRAKERALGKPYDGAIEEMVADEPRRDFIEGSRRRGAFPQRSRFVGSTGETGASERPRKPPKGWTGKKRDFGNATNKKSSRPNNMGREIGRRNSKRRSSGSDSDGN